jgi:hypothetical protein
MPTWKPHGLHKWKYIDDKIVVFLSHSSPDIDCRCSPGGDDVRLPFPAGSILE